MSPESKGALPVIFGGVAIAAITAATAWGFAAAGSSGSQPMSTWQLDAQVQLSNQGYTGAQYLGTTPYNDQSAWASKGLIFNVKAADGRLKTVVVDCDQAHSNQGENIGGNNGGAITCKVLAPS